MSADIALEWFAGTLRLRGSVLGPPCARWDPNEACFHAPASAYAAIVLWLKARELTFIDSARAYRELSLTSSLPALRPFQRDAVAAWRATMRRGTVVLPTGAGKTVVAMAAIAQSQRSTLVVVPTLDLMAQWRRRLAEAFALNPDDIGLVGGGSHDIRELTVSTYDSAWAHMQHFGNRFGLVVFDEVHHLCSESYAVAARMCLAPYRLGLTATPERADGKDALLSELVGDICFRREIEELEGAYLAPYDLHSVEIELTVASRLAYDTARQTYREFIVDQGIRMSSASGWGEFIKRSGRTAEGRAALLAYRTQRAIAFAAPEKLAQLSRILAQHQGVRTLVFTDDNATAYTIARQFLVPVITHQTKVKERATILQGFADGTLPVVATSRVLNEGIDVPDAQVAVIMSGSGSVREHVQRLGRILRPKAGKRAVLYELVTKDTAEAFTSQRRRQHSAYR